MPSGPTGKPSRIIWMPIDGNRMLALTHLYSNPARLFLYVFQFTFAKYCSWHLGTSDGMAGNPLAASSLLAIQSKLICFRGKIKYLLDLELSVFLPPTTQTWNGQRVHITIPSVINIHLTHATVSSTPSFQLCSNPWPRQPSPQCRTIQKNGNVCGKG